MDAFARLESVIPDYEHRPEQLALAEAVARALDTEEHLLAQAGTGTGKSLGYLLPALDSGRRVVVATATKALQEQLLTKDVPLAAAALGRTVRVAVVKGRQNYLCRRRVEGVQLTGPGLLGGREGELAYERLLPWIGSTATGDRAELEEEPSASLWAELAVGPDRCLGRRCPHVTRCFAEKARQRAGDADLVIANHALYFADLALREHADGASVLPEHDAVIFDEAHKLEESRGELARSAHHGRSGATPRDGRRPGRGRSGGSPAVPRRGDASRRRSRSCCGRSSRRAGAAACASCRASRPSS